MKTYTIRMQNGKLCNRNGNHTTKMKDYTSGIDQTLLQCLTCHTEMPGKLQSD